MNTCRADPRRKYEHELAQLLGLPPLVVHLQSGNLLAAPHRCAAGHTRPLREGIVMELSKEIQAYCAEMRNKYRSHDNSTIPMSISEHKELTALVFRAVQEDGELTPEEVEALLDPEIMGFLVCGPRSLHYPCPSCSRSSVNRRKAGTSPCGWDEGPSCMSSTNNWKWEPCPWDLED